MDETYKTVYQLDDSFNLLSPEKLEHEKLMCNNTYFDDKKLYPGYIYWEKYYVYKAEIRNNIQHVIVISKNDPRVKEIKLLKVKLILIENRSSYDDNIPAWAFLPPEQYVIGKQCTFNFGPFESVIVELGEIEDEVCVDDINLHGTVSSISCNV